MKKVLMVLTALAVLASLSFAQEVSKKKDLSLFDISFFKDSLDRGVVDGVDAKVRQVFVNMGRFNVLGLDFRLDAIDVSDFVSKVKQIKEESTTRAKEFQFGEKIFTLAEYNKLVGSFIVVIPQITNYSVEQKRGGGYEVLVDTSFTFNRGADMSAIKVVNLSTSGNNKSRERAIREALDAIPIQLEFEIRKIEEFQILSGIIDLQNSGDVVIELGRNMGIQVGDEYSLQSVNQSFGDKDEIGLLQIKDVRADKSVARVVYGDATLGAPVQEIPRLGVDFEPYLLFGPRTVTYTLNTFIKSYNYTRTDNMLTVGVKATMARGFYDVRPTVSMDYSFEDTGIWGLFFIPFNVFVGGDYYLYLSRLDIKLGAAVGATAIYVPSYSDDPVGYSHFGLQGHGGFNFLVNRDWKISADAGARILIGKSSFWGNKTYLFGGASMVYKY